MSDSRGDDLVPGEIAIEVRRIAEEHVVGVQLIGLAAEAADALQAEHELRFGLHAAAIDLVGRRSLGGQPGDFLHHDRLELRQRVTRGGGRGHLHEAGDLTRVLRGRDVGRNPLLEDQPTVEA